MLAMLHGQSINCGKHRNSSQKVSPILELGNSPPPDPSHDRTGKGTWEFQPCISPHLPIPGMTLKGTSVHLGASQMHGCFIPSTFPI